MHMIPKPQPCMKNYRQLRNEGVRYSLPQGRARQQIIQYQMVSSESTHSSYIIQAKQVVFRNVYYMYTHVDICNMHVTTIDEEAINLEE